MYFKSKSTIQTVSASKDVFDNQYKIDILNTILANCGRGIFKNCSLKFIHSIEKQLSEEISKAKKRNAISE